MGWRLSGAARIDRFVTADRSLHLTLSGALLSVVMVLQGIVLLMPVTTSVAPFAGILDRILPVELWGCFALLIGVVQCTGYALTWTGIVPPQRTARMFTAACTSGYFSAIATTTVLGGFTFGAPVYLMLVVLATRDLNESYRAA